MFTERVLLMTNMINMWLNIWGVPCISKSNSEHLGIIYCGKSYIELYRPLFWGTNLQSSARKNTRDPLVWGNFSKISSFARGCCTLYQNNNSFFISTFIKNVVIRKKPFLPCEYHIWFQSQSAAIWKDSEKCKNFSQLLSSSMGK